MPSNILFRRRSKGMSIFFFFKSNFTFVSQMSDEAQKVKIRVRRKKPADDSVSSNSSTTTTSAAAADANSTHHHHHHHHRKLSNEDAPSAASSGGADKETSSSSTSKEKRVRRKKSSERGNSTAGESETSSRKHFTAFQRFFANLSISKHLNAFCCACGCRVFTMRATKTQ
jgi:hypothetical protein